MVLWTPDSGRRNCSNEILDGLKYDEMGNFSLDNAGVLFSLWIAWIFLILKEDFLHKVRQGCTPLIEMIQAIIAWA